MCNGISGVGLTKKPKKKQDWQNDCMTDWQTGQKHHTGIPRNFVDWGIIKISCNNRGLIGL